MNSYYWTIDYYTRKGAYSRTASGILKAENEDAAHNILWEKMGNDFACCPCVTLIDPDADFIQIN